MAGRRGLYENWITPDGLLTIEGWAREGATDLDIAKHIGIGERTFTDWKARFPAIVAALKKGKAPVDFQVENQLLKSALGYTVTVKEPFKLKKKTIKNGVGTVEEEHIEYADREIYIKPEITAQIFWLKNRKPGKWRDKPIPDAGVDDPLYELLNKWNEAAANAHSEHGQSDSE